MTDDLPWGQLVELKAELDRRIIRFLESAPRRQASALAQDLIRNTQTTNTKLLSYQLPQANSSLGPASG